MKNVYECVGVQKIDSKDGTKHFLKLNLVSTEGENNDKMVGCSVSQPFLSEDFEIMSADGSAVTITNPFDIAGKRVRVFKETVNGLDRVTMLMIVPKSK